MTASRRITSFVVAVFAVMAVLSVAGTGPAVAADVAIGKAAPDFTSRSVTGDVFRLSDFQGRQVLLTFWSTWCSLNREELAFLRDLEDRHPDLVFVVVDAGSPRPDIRSLAQVWQAAEEWAIEAVVIPDKGLELTDLYGVKALPTSLIIDARGQIAHAQPNFFSPDMELVERTLGRSQAFSSLPASMDGAFGN